MFNFANNIQFMSDKDKYVKLLIGDVEERLGRGMLSPKDFEYLHGIIASELNESVSVSTLKRLWGYSKYLSSPSVSILSILCRLVGYRDWEDYRANREKEDNAPSAIVLNDKITVATDLEVGDRIRLTWAPQRVCDIQYHGDGDFEVVAAVNTGIKAGDWFCCSLIVSGEPLWISNLRQFGKAPVAYVCGKQGGVRFELIHNS